MPRTFGARNDIPKLVIARAGTFARAAGGLRGSAASGGYSDRSSWAGTWFCTNKVQSKILVPTRQMKRAKRSGSGQKMAPLYKGAIFRAPQQKSPWQSVPFGNSLVRTACLQICHGLSQIKTDRPDTVSHRTRGIRRYLPTSLPSGSRPQSSVRRRFYIFGFCKSRGSTPRGVPSPN